MKGIMIIETKTFEQYQEMLKRLHFGISAVQTELDKLREVDQEIQFYFAELISNKAKDKIILNLEVDRDYWQDKAERYAQELPADLKDQ